MDKLLVGISRDVLDSRGEPSFGREPLRLLDDEPGVAYEFLPEPVAALMPDHLAGYDALYINSPLVTGASFGDGACRTRIIARHGVGYDSVDLEACTAHDVMVTVQREPVRRPVATAAITYVLALAQKLRLKDQLTRTGRWNERLDHMGMGLTGRTLGLVGAGSIGHEILRLAQPFGMRLLVTDPYVDPASIEALDARLVDLERLLQEADFVVVICNLTEETRGLIGQDALSLMKRSAYLINVARGPIVDETALIDALRAGSIAGAGLDVFAQEPVDPANPLLAMENVLVTPHALCWTDECFAGLAVSAITSILAAGRGERPRHVVNPQVLDRPGLRDWLARNAEHR